MKLTAKHLELYEKVSKRGAGRGCSDLLVEEKKILTFDQWKELCKAFHDWNGDPKEFDESSHYVLPDFCILSYLRFLILNEVKKNLPKTYQVTVEFEGCLVREILASNAEEASSIVMDEYCKLDHRNLNLSIQNQTVKLLDNGAK